MNAIEKKINELEAYAATIKPNLSREEMEAYWNPVLETYRRKPLNAVRERVNTPYSLTDTFHVTYDGYDQTPIHGWFIVPKQRVHPLPCVVVFQGYSSDKGYPERYAGWLLAGYTVFAVDTRGQSGETGNRLGSEHGQTSGWVSQGILDRDASYYKAIAIDCLRAIDCAAEQAEVDHSRIAVTGVSQGGGLALISSALSTKVAAVLANIPNQCQMDFGMLFSSSSLTELSRFSSIYPQHLPAILDTIRYFDNLNLAYRLDIPVMVSVCLKDSVCMPETVYAMFHQLQCKKELRVYPFLGHEVNEYQHRQGVLFLNKSLAIRGG